jgi:hypothetical protein
VSVRQDPDRFWEQLTSFSDTFTCYSAAIATWAAWEHRDWRRLVNPGLWLTVGERADGLFAFGHFRPGLRAALGLVRTGMDGAAAEAAAAVVAEMRRCGRVIVAGDGFHLPWHVAFGRRHVPHWYVLLDAPQGPTVMDPFACRNDLGLQAASRHVLDEGRVGRIIAGLPGDDPVLALRESLALGDDAGLPSRLPYQWYVRGAVEGQHPPAESVPADSAIQTAPADLTGAHGPEAVRLLAAHFRANGQQPSAYRQADDLWSIARHRAFLYRYAQRRAGAAGDDALSHWVDEHGEPLAKKWGHIAPLVMQASLALGSGRAASASVPDTLEQLAERERSADLALARISSTI